MASGTDGRCGVDAAAERVFDDAMAQRPRGGLTLGDVAAGVVLLAVALACAFVPWSGNGSQAGGTQAPGRAVEGAVDAGKPAADVRDGAVQGLADAPVSALYAVVQNTRGFYEVVPLDSDAVVTVESDLGTNVVEVRDGRVRCSESDCANQICVDSGWVGGAGGMVVCLPHELTVQVVADPDDAIPLL